VIARVTVRSAAAGDWSRIVSLLSAAGLPTADLQPQSVASFLVATDVDGVIGAVAVERHSGHGLLRSLVVAPERRGQGLGRQLVAAAEADAAVARLDALTLLTQSAGSWFRALGYEDIPRAEAAVALQASAEFAHLCPGSSECLIKNLKV